MYLDLDRFKHVNDMMGHVVGDKLLQEVADRLTGISGKTDTVCRLGGDEYVVLLTDVGHMDDVSAMAERIISAVATPLNIDGHELGVTTSIGIAVYPEDGADSLEILQHADAAMYQAKQAGRNRYHFFTSEMNNQALARMAIEHKLHRALERKEFSLHYQPQVDLATGRTVGAEVLLRWEDRSAGGYISPAEFIPIAEENGMIVAIGEWVLAESCKHMAERRRAGLPDLPVSINLSAVQCRQKNLADSFRAIFEQYGIEPFKVELEITETAVMQDAETSIALLHEFREMGVRLAMDDFGTGYSSLSYLKRLPIDKLKIDQSFVRDISDDPDDAAIVNTIINMARSLELTVVAEGVENEKQLTFLNRHGCDQGQGYFFSRPIPHHEYSAYLGKVNSAV